MKRRRIFIVAAAMLSTSSGCLEIQGMLGKKGFSTNSASSLPDQAEQTSDVAKVSTAKAVTLGESVEVTHPPSEIPQVTLLRNVVLDSNLTRVLGKNGNNINCASSIPSRPIMKLSLKTAMPPTMAVVASGAFVDGVVLVRDGQMVWDCAMTTGKSPALKGVEWSAGDYDVYVVSLKSPSKTTDVHIELVDETKPADLREIKTIAISKPLAKPMFFTATLASETYLLSEDRQGRNCKLPLPLMPDFALDIAKPMKGLVIRPLYTEEPVWLRVHTMTGDDKPGYKNCVGSFEDGSAGPNGTPTYHAPSEYSIGYDFEGMLPISLGVRAASAQKTFTFMVYDETTTFDWLATNPDLPASLPLEKRLMSYAFPQLDYSKIGVASTSGQELTAKLFGAAPKQIWVYPTSDWDEQTAELLSDEVQKKTFPHKDEPLLLFGFDGEWVQVLAADGVAFRTKPKRLATAPSEGVTPLAKPTPLRDDLKLEKYIALAGKSGNALVTGYDRMLEKYGACADKVASKYDSAIDRERWTLRSNTGPDVVVESGKAQHIRNKADAAVEKTCGSEDRIYAAEDTLIKKLIPLIEKQRAVWLQKANSKF